MPSIQVDLNDEEDKTVQLTKVYNDLNGDCVDFFRAVRDRPDELERWVEHTPYSRELFDEYVEAYPEWPDDLVKRAGRFLYVQNTSFGGKGLTTDNPTFQVRQMAESRNDRGRVYYQEERLQKLSERFKGVYIEKLDYAELIEKYDQQGTFFYCDPPYVNVGDDYYQTEEGGFDHSRFVQELENTNGKWMVSYDENIPDELKKYETVLRTKGATITAQTPEKIETLTMNYDPKDTPMFRGQEQSGLGKYQ